MLETSKDLLNLTIAFCILWFTAFVCWLIYYFAMILRGVKQTIDKFTKTLDAVTGFFNQAKAKIDGFTSNISTIIETAKKVSDFVGKHKKPKTTKKQQNKN